MILIMRTFPLIAAILGLCGTAAAAARGQESAAQAPNQALTERIDAAAPRATPPAPLPDAAGAVETYFAARRWLDDAGPKAVVPTPADVHSAAVVLRLHGAIVGLGKDAGNETGGSIVDRALRAALDDARAHRASHTSTTEERESIGALTTLELELGGTREPLIGRTFEEIARSIEPGECGLQMTDAVNTAYMPASHLLARRMASPVSRALLAMVTDLRLPPRDLPDLQALGGHTAVYAVHSIRLAQLAPSKPPFALARVLPAVANEPATRTEGAAACTEIVTRLAAQLDPAPSAEGLPADAATQMARTGLRGDYAIAADRYEPFIAGPSEQGLCAWALAHAAATASWPVDLRARAAHTSARTLRALADVDPSERDPVAEPAAVAYCVLALSETPAAGTALPAADLQPPAAFAKRMTDALVAVLPRTSLATMRPHIRAAVLDAAAALDVRGTPGMPRAELLAAIDTAWSDTQPAELPLVVPLLIDAERRLATPDVEARLEAHRTAMDAARTVLLGTQIRAGDPLRPSSLLDAPGAFPLTGSAAGRISAQSLRAQVFVAMIAGMPATRSAERDVEDSRSIGWATRFLRQLMAPASIAYCARVPERALGGVMASPADAAQPVAAQAIAILALTESERAWARLEAAKPAR